jgi:hypothetical protein
MLSKTFNLNKNSLLTAAATVKLAPSKDIDVNKVN